MQLSLIFLLLQLWGNAEVSLSQNACSKLPDVPHAHVSEETKKSEYQDHDVIHFTCEPGYISDETSKYVCTSKGWLTVRQEMCYTCLELPDVPHASISEETKKAEYQVGDMIHFTCEPGYISGPTIKYVCTSRGWLAVHRGTCYFPASSCDAPPADGGITVKGLPGNDDPILPDDVLTFSCDGPVKFLEGSSVLICGKDGQWDNPFPSCRDITCKVDVMHPHLNIVGPQANKTIKIGHKLQFFCDDEYALDGSEEIECLETGQWNAAFPTCSDKCTVEGVPGNVRLHKYVEGAQLRKGEKLRFYCLLHGHFLRGNEEVECLANGLWSDLFPTCGAPLGCGKPPYVQDGDIKISAKFQYEHNERVEYICQNLYTMEGTPYKTCYNGEWTGDMTCLKPCTVNEEVMRAHNIAFRYTHDKKLYAAHNDEIDFMCTRGTRRTSTVGMRQRCLNGVMLLPTCH